MTSSEKMGEVRARIRLTNAEDELLVRRGEIVPGQVRTCEADALVDTGAVRSILPATVAGRLGLGIRGKRLAEYADGRREEVGITDSVVFEWNGRDTLEEALILGDEVIIGQTVLEKLDLLVDCTNQRLVPAHPDQPISKVKRSGVPRNLTRSTSEGEARIQELAFALISRRR